MMSENKKEEGIFVLLVAPRRGSFIFYNIPKAMICGQRCAKRAHLNRGFYSENRRGLNT